MEIEKFLQTILTKESIYKNEPMSKHTTFKIGGKAEYFLKIDNIDTLLYVYLLNKNNTPVTIVGNGSNLLVTDKGIKGITIKPSFKIIEKEETKDEIIYRVGSGVSIIALAVKALEDSATGLEFAQWNTTELLVVQFA